MITFAAIWKELKRLAPRTQLIAALILMFGALMLFYFVFGQIESCRRRNRDKKFDENINRHLENANQYEQNANTARDTRLEKQGAANQIEKQLGNQEKELTDYETNSNNALRWANNARNANISGTSPDEYQRAKCVAFPELPDCQ